MSKKKQQKSCETWYSEWSSLLYMVTVVQGSMSSVIGQHLSREHLLLAAQGNCTFTNSLSSFTETETEGGLKASGGGGGGGGEKGKKK